MINHSEKSEYGRVAQIGLILKFTMRIFFSQLKTVLYGFLIGRYAVDYTVGPIRPTSKKNTVKSSKRGDWNAEFYLS